MGRCYHHMVLLKSQKNDSHSDIELQSQGSNHYAYYLRKEETVGQLLEERNQIMASFSEFIIVLVTNHHKIYQLKVLVPKR